MEVLPIRPGAESYPAPGAWTTIRPTSLFEPDRSSFLVGEHLGQFQETDSVLVGFSGSFLRHDFLHWEKLYWVCSV